MRPATRNLPDLGVTGLGDVASAEGEQGRCQQGQGVAGNQRRRLQSRPAGQGGVLGLVGDDHDDVVAQQPGRPVGAQAADGVLDDGEIAKGDAKGGGGVAAKGGDRQAQGGPDDRDGRDPQADAAQGPQPIRVDSVGGPAQQPRRQQCGPQEELQDDCQGEHQCAGGDQLGGQDPDPAGLPGQQGGHGAGMPLGTDQRRPQQPAQDDREPAGPDQDLWEVLVVEPAVLHRRDEPLLAELGAVVGRHVGGDALELAGDAPLDLDLAGRLGLGQAGRVGVPRDQEGDRPGGQDGQHGQGGTDPDQPPGQDPAPLDTKQGDHRATSIGCSPVSSRNTVSRSASSARSSVRYRPSAASALVTVAASSGGRATRNTSPSGAAWMPAAASTTRPRSRSPSRTNSPTPRALLSTWATGPAATHRPRARMATWSQVWRTSDSRWLDTNTVRPSPPSPRSSSRTSLMPAGSNPLAGSSRINTSGSLSSAAARPRRWRIPSD